MARKRSKGHVGIAGLGIMGGAFAKNLVDAGWRVTGFDIDAKARNRAKRAGVEIAADIAALAHAAPVIITSLPMPQALHDVARQIAKAKLPRRVIADTSTFTLEDKEKAE